MKKTIQIGTLSAAAGEKKQGYYTLPKSTIQMPVTIVNGCHEGKTVLITSGIHGGEYPGIQTGIQLARELSPQQVHGAVVFIHPVNVSAFVTRSKQVMPEDGQNLNRAFPGNNMGTITHRTAYALTRDFQSLADFYLDLHGGDLDELVTPYVYYPGVAEKSVIAASRAAACLVDVSYMVRSNATTGAYNYAAIQGVPSLLIERGGSGLWSREEVEAYKKDVTNVLRHLHVLEGEPFVPKEPKEITNAIYLDADFSGCWYPCVQVGQTLKKGDKLGEITDYFGNVQKAYYTPCDAVVLYITVTLGIEQGHPLLALGEI